MGASIFNEQALRPGEQVPSLERLALKMYAHVEFAVVLSFLFNNHKGGHRDFILN